MALRDLKGLGTPEAVWATWDAPATWPHADLEAPRRVVVVAPHPDDEVLGVGGTMQMLALRGVEIRILGVTDGERSHPGTRLGRGEALAEVRNRERTKALGRAGLSDVPVERLHIPDTAVDRHQGALERVLIDRLADADWCLATWRGDRHPDHDAVGRAAAVACRATDTSLYEFPVWTWRWAHPSDQSLAWPNARRVDLPPPVVEAKASAIDALDSGVGEVEDPIELPVLPPDLLARYLRSWEVLLAS